MHLNKIFICRCCWESLWQVYRDQEVCLWISGRL